MKFPIRAVVLAAGAGLIGSLPRMASAARPGEGVRSIILIDLCSARRDRIGKRRSGGEVTPSLDSFAEESVVFENAWAVAQWSLPNLATLMTGVRPEVHGQFASFASTAAFDADKAPEIFKRYIYRHGDAPIGPLNALERLPEVLRSSGYRTAGFSRKIFFRPSAGLERGFDVFHYAEGGPGTERNSSENDLPAVLKWIDENRGNKFFLYLNVNDLHLPYGSPDPGLYDPGYRGLLDDSGIDSEFAACYGNLEPEDWKPGLKARVGEFRRDPRHLRHLIAMYDAAYHHADALLGRLFHELKARGLWDESMVIVTGEHGELLGEHGLLSHGPGLYEPALNVPLMIKMPGATGGRKVKALASRLDLPATLLDAVGALSAHPQFAGNSLLPVVEGAESGGSGFLYASSLTLDSGGRSSVEEETVRDGRYQLIRSCYAAGSRPPYELYDLWSDPGESEDLSKARPEVLRRMLNGMEEARKTASSNDKMEASLKQGEKK